jgi:hypothetical protein
VNRTTIDAPAPAPDQTTQPDAAGSTTPTDSTITTVRPGGVI